MGFVYSTWIQVFDINGNLIVTSRGLFCPRCSREPSSVSSRPALSAINSSWRPLLTQAKMDQLHLLEMAIDLRPTGVVILEDFQNRHDKLDIFKLTTTVTNGNLGTTRSVASPHRGASHLTSLNSNVQACTPGQSDLSHIDGL